MKNPIKCSNIWGGRRGGGGGGGGRVVWLLHLETLQTEAKNDIYISVHHLLQLLELVFDGETYNAGFSPALCIKYNFMTSCWPSQFYSSKSMAVSVDAGFTSQSLFLTCSLIAFLNCCWVTWKSGCSLCRILKFEQWMKDVSDKGLH